MLSFEYSGRLQGRISRIDQRKRVGEEPVFPIEGPEVIRVEFEKGIMLGGYRSRVKESRWVVELGFHLSSLGECERQWLEPVVFVSRWCLKSHKEIKGTEDLFLNQQFTGDWCEGD